MSFHGVKDEGSFKTHAPYLREAFDGGTKVTQLAKAKLGSKDFGTKHEDAKWQDKERKQCKPYNMMAKVMYESCNLSSHRPRETARRTQRCWSRWSKRVRKRRVQRDSTTQNQVSVRIEVNSKECHDVVKADLPITKKGKQMRDNG
ncbi:hypothetical protein B296_00033619 [Ensete ventricosum]|uniref:Uncharacterized protein n=1 Tax=Ensete ventricosum TaxID=4639 RepID=A0A426ZEI8_ENSVE|nr:hypothetical protein B296_00033619 [Ensete ventricosum]